MRTYNVTLRFFKISLRKTTHNFCALGIKAIPCSFDSFNYIQDKFCGNRFFDKLRINLRGDEANEKTSCSYGRLLCGC